MQDHEVELRREWARALLASLSDANLSLEAMTRETATHPETGKESVRREGEEKLRAKQELHAQQIQTLKDGHAGMTAIMNDFHAFREDPAAQQRWSYPFLLTRKGREANQKLKRERERMSTLVLQHRLLEEEIRRLTDSVQREASVLFNGSEALSAWKEMLEDRQRLVEDLCLLLASIPETARCELDPRNPAAIGNLLGA